MTRAWLLLILSALLLAGLTFFLTSRDADPPSLESVREASKQEVAPGANEVVTAAPPIDMPQLNAEVAPIRTTIPTPNAKRNVVYSTEAEEGLMVIVVDGDTKEPLPFAEVMVIDTGVSDMRMLEAEMTLRPDFEAVFESLGVVYRTDSNAKVRIPFALGANIIAGRTPTHFNFSLDVDEDVEELTLYLNPVELLKVQVVNQTGGPVKGAPICLRVRNGVHAQDLTTAYTDKDGFASLKLFQLLLMELADDPTFVALLVLTPEPVEIPVKLKQLPEIPPVLVVPDVGKVQVKIVDEKGDPILDNFLINVELLRPEDKMEVLEDISSWDNPREHLSSRTKTGSVEFPLVAFGQRLHVSVVSIDGERRADILGEGPVRHGDPAIFYLTPKVKDPVLVGRILNTEGNVGPNLNLDYRLHSIAASVNIYSNSTPLKTNAKGVFRLLMDDVYREGTTRTLTISMKATKRKPKRTVSMDLSFMLDPGEYDVGDMVLRALPLIAAGRVMDMAGVPIKGARVSLEHRIFYGENADQYEWYGTWELRTESNRDGEFTIGGDVEPGDYRVSALADSYRQSSTGFSFGDETVELRLERGVDVVGQFLLDDGLDATKLTALIQTKNPEFSNRKLQFRTKLAKDGSFTLKNLPAGLASLSLTSEFMEKDLFTKVALQLSNAQETQTLANVDMRGRLHTIRLWVRNVQGENLKGVKVWPIDAKWQRKTDDSPIDIISLDPAINLIIGANGYRSVKLEHAQGERDVILGQGFLIRLDLTNPNVLSEDWTLRARLHPIALSGTSEADRRYADQVSRFGADAEPHSLQAYGTYAVNFWLQGPSSSNYAKRDINMEPIQIEVANLSSLQIFTLTLDAGAVARTMQKDLR